MRTTGEPDGVTTVQPPPPIDRRDLVVEVAGVAKRFGSIQALERLHIEVPRSRITVLLGPNGAGKTTAMRLITGAITADRGTVSVLGLDPSGRDGEDVRRRCGVVSAKPALYDRLSGLDNLRYAAELYGLGRGSSVDQRLAEAASWFGIEDALHQLVGGYSTGMKTRLALTRAVLHDPELLLLDEPTSGLDPESAQAVLRLVRDMTERGRSVLLCTHLLLEAEGLADQVVIVQDGVSLMWGDPALLARRYWPHPEVTVRTWRPSDLNRILDHPGLVGGQLDGDGVRLTLPEERAVGPLVQWMADHDILVRAVTPIEPSLEDLYFAVRSEYRTRTTDQDGPASGGWVGQAVERQSAQRDQGQREQEQRP